MNNPWRILWTKQALLVDFWGHILKQFALKENFCLLFWGLGCPETCVKYRPKYRPTYFKMKDHCYCGCGFLVCGGELIVGGGNVCYDEGGPDSIGDGFWEVVLNLPL